MDHPFLMILFALFFSACTARDTITPSQPLTDNETLISSGGDFALGFFTPTNSNNRYVGLWYNTITPQTIVWVANRDKPIVNSIGILSVTSSGVLTITDGSSTVVWSVNVSGLITNAVAQLLETGNFVVKNINDDNSEDYAWQGFDYPTDTLIAGMRIGVDRITGLNRTVTSWKSDNDPSPGAYHCFMDIEGDPEIYLYSGSQKIWRTGAWNGEVWSGIPQSYDYPGLVSNDQEVTYSFDIYNKSNVSNIRVDGSGTVQHIVWMPDRSQWNIYWFAPDDPCDNYGKCGPFGACDANNSSKCECLLPAFTPANPGNWALRDWSDGCVRKTRLDCKNGTDGFVLVSSVKLPESDNTTVPNYKLGLDECQALCLVNCSCTAYASANVSGSGSGCVVWFSQLVDIRVFVGAGQDLYVRVSSADIDSPPQPEKKKVKTVAILVSLLSGALLFSCVGCFLWKRNKWIKGAQTKFSKQSKKVVREKDMDIPIYDFGTIAAATDRFSDGNKLGQGGFGPVYKGKLGEDQDIAVKRLAKTSLQGTEEFKNEVMLIAKLQNRNLVQLLGCCIEGEERMLIYEYMPNKSLDAFLFAKEKSALLDWRTRYQIIVGITRGLFYLHHDSRFRIIHRDLKASNILLDEKMNPKISDFGMARLFGGDETDFNTRKVVGTYGYMSPEYAMQGTFSLKSDVFSFGVLLLEIISGKKNRGIYAFSSHLSLVAHAWSLWNEGDILELVDESMSNTFPRNDVLKCIKIGLLCVEDQPDDRPLMSSVIEMLSADIASLPQPKQPGFIGRIVPLESDRLENRQSSGTSNGLTFTLDGR